MLEQIISGCHPGAEIGAIDAAIVNDFPCGGWIQRGNPVARIGNGLFREMPTDDYPECREQNVIDSDATIIFIHGNLSQSSDLGRYAIKHSKPWMLLDMTKNRPGDAVLKIIDMVRFNRLNVINITGASAEMDSKIYVVTYTTIQMLLKTLI